METMDPSYTGSLVLFGSFCDLTPWKHDTSYIMRHAASTEAFLNPDFHFSPELELQSYENRERSTSLSHSNCCAHKHLSHFRFFKRHKAINF